MRAFNAAVLLSAMILLSSTVKSWNCKIKIELTPNAEGKFEIVAKIISHLNHALLEEEMDSYTTSSEGLLFDFVKDSLFFHDKNGNDLNYNTSSTHTWQYLDKSGIQKLTSLQNCRFAEKNDSFVPSLNAGSVKLLINQPDNLIV